MQTISELVRNVAIIVLIAGFLEMLLPSSEMKRFVKMVMGLFILVSMLNPLVSLFRQEKACEVFAWQDPVQGIELNSIIAKGEEVSRSMEEKARTMYGENMARQVETIVKLVKGVSWVEADVEMKEADGQPDYAGIDRVVLVIGTGKGETKTEIEPVDISTQKEEPRLITADGEKEIKSQVEEALKNFYHLKDEQIHIVIVSE